MSHIPKRGIATRSELLELLRYEPDTGRFYWRKRSKGLALQRGDLRAGCMRHDGYNIIRVHRIAYLAHRLAWLAVYGRWPEHDIDHINGVRGDDRIANLRDVPRRINLENQRKARPRNRAGMLGVTFASGRYMARIQVNQRQILLGCFGTAKEAHAEYLKAKRKLHEGCTL